MKIYFYIFIVFFGLAAFAADKTLSEQIPDIKQLSDLLPNGGGVYCGPTAMGNVLIWFSHRGFDRLVPQPCDDAHCEYALIGLLGSKDYFGADKGWIDEDDLTKGLKKFLGEKSYQAETMEYWGWGKKKVTHPTPEDLEKVLSEKGGVIINMGFYNLDQKRNIYTREGLHWITLVGADKNHIVVHDPALSEKKDVSWQVTPLTHGTLSWEKHKSIPAAGFYQIAKKIKDPNTVVLLEGAFILKLK